MYPLSVVFKTELVCNEGILSIKFFVWGKTQVVWTGKQEKCYMQMEDSPSKEEPHRIGKGKNGLM